MPFLISKYHHFRHSFYFLFYRMSCCFQIFKYWSRCCLDHDSQVPKTCILSIYFCWSKYTHGL